MDHQVHQEKVLKAARSLMAKHGRNFTLVDLCKKARIGKSQLRRIYSTKAVLLSALDGEKPTAVVEVNAIIETNAPASTLNGDDANPTAVVEVGGTREIAGPASTLDGDDANPTAIVEYNVINDNNEPVDRRFRVLQRAITLLESRIDAVDAERRRQELVRETAGMECALSDEPQSSGVLDPVIARGEADVMREEPAAANCDASPEPLMAAETDLPPVVEDIPVRPRLGIPGISRQVLDNARVLALATAEKNTRQEKSQRKSNMLTLMSAATIVAAGLVVGVTSMGGAARATRAPFATASESLASASGVTTINATGAVVADQISPTAQGLIDRAEKGDTGAQADLAMAYLRGDGVVSNSAAAAGWAGLAAAKGDPLGQFILATLYNSGIKPDQRTGFRWMSASALNGNVKAMHNVAVALVSGWGVEKNPVEAANWFGKAASMGYRDSAFDLAVLYERGEGVPQSTQRALYWYDKAAAAGDRESAQRASLLRFGVPKTEQELHN